VARYQVGIQTEAKIIEATRALLAEGGMEAATLKAICDRAEVRSGSFYNLFDSKEDVIIHVVRESINAVDPDPDHAGTDTVGDLVSAYIRFFEEEPQLAKVYVMAALTGGSDSLTPWPEQIRHWALKSPRFRQNSCSVPLTASRSGGRWTVISISRHTRSLQLTNWSK